MRTPKELTIEAAMAMSADYRAADEAVTPPRPSASGDLEHASATHRTVLLHAIAIGARPERVEAIVEALIVAVRAEALELAAKRAESRGLCNCSPGYIAGQIRALVSK